MTQQELPLIVFDCDYTLWPFDCDKDVVAPFCVHSAGGIIDRSWRPANPFPEVREVFQYIVENKMSFAIASRNPSANSIAQLLACIMIQVDGVQKSVWSMLPAGSFHAYSSGGAKGKTAHFARISQATGRPVSDMLFFDDLSENIQVASQQGVICVLVGQRTGLTMDTFKCGLEAFAKMKAERLALALALAAQQQHQQQQQKIEVVLSIQESPNEVQASVSERQGDSSTTV
jgi:magnesium-dependent phosphatase-1